MPVLKRRGWSGSVFSKFWRLGSGFSLPVLKRRFWSRSVFSKFWDWNLIFIASFEKTGLVPISLFKLFGLGIGFFMPVFEKTGLVPISLFKVLRLGIGFDSQFRKDGFDSDRSFQGFCCWELILHAVFTVFAVLMASFEKTGLVPVSLFKVLRLEIGFDAKS